VRYLDSLGEDYLDSTVRLTAGSTEMPE